MIKKCHACKQPINNGKYQFGWTPAMAYQHWTNLNARWYSPLDTCPSNTLLKVINIVIAKVRGYNPNKGWHGINEKTGEKIV